MPHPHIPGQPNEPSEQLKLIKLARPVHDDGDPHTCAASCPGPHYRDQAPEVCADCGGSGRGCWPTCQHQSRRYEPGEGRTGADEFYPADDYD